MGVTPNHPVIDGCSIINHPAIGVPPHSRKPPNEHLLGFNFLIQLIFLYISEEHFKSMDVSEVNWNRFLNDATIYQVDETWMYKNKIQKQDILIG